jgi:hypothetical protein
MNSYKSSLNFSQCFKEFFLILYSMNRRRELARLVEWAHRRNLFGPFDAYRRKLNVDDLRLKYYASRSPLISCGALSRFPSTKLHAKRVYCRLSHVDNLTVESYL